MNAFIANLIPLKVIDGGTGNTTKPKAGQLLIGDYDGRYQVNNLIAGANIVITNGSGVVTITATGPGLVGPVGPPIYLVAEGEEGPQGPPGPQGLQGTVGSAGSTGAQGPVGPPIFLVADEEVGDQGPPGIQGPQGVAGTNGFTGSQGPIGPPVFLVADAEYPEPGPLSPGATNLPSFTTGSVIFAGLSGALTQDNANLFWDDPNNRFGVGTSSPADTLDVRGGIITGSATAATDAYIELGGNGSGDRNAYIDLHGDSSTYVDFGCRLIRNSGPNGGTTMSSRGTGALKLNCQEAAPITFETSNTEKVRIDDNELKFQKGLKGSRTNVADIAYTQLVTDFIISYGTLTAARTVTLASAATNGDGKIIIIKDAAGTAAANNITVDGNASETIDGALTQKITNNYGVMRLFCNGSNWFTW